MSFGSDVWLKTITLTEDNNKFRITEGTTCVFEIKTGNYLLHNDPAFDSNGSGLPGLYHAIRDVLNDNILSPFYVAHTGTLPSASLYDFETADPTITPFIPSSGLRFGASPLAFSINFDHADFTMDPRWFGFLSGIAISQLESGFHWIYSPVSVFGRWYSMSLYDGVASRKHPIPFANVEYSSKRVADAVSIPWEIGLSRRFVYPFVHSAHLFNRRAENLEHANAAGIGFGDVHNAFEDSVWQSLITSERLLVMHDTGRGTLYPTATQFEIVKLMGRWDEFKPTRESYRGEFYRLELRVWIDPVVGRYAF